MIARQLRWLALTLALTACGSSVVLIDVKPPEVTVTSPTTSSVTTYLLQGTIKDASGIQDASYRLNGGASQPLTLDAEGKFSLSLSLQQGQNTVEIQARDMRGNLQTTTHLIVQQTLPVLTEILPSQGLEVGDTLVTLKGTDLQGTTKVTLDGNSVPFNVTQEGHITFTTPPHSKGEVQVTVTTPSGTSNALTYRYVPFGVLTFYPGNVGSFAMPDLVLDAQENLYVSWWVNKTLSVSKVSSQGKRLWDWRFESGGSMNVKKLQVDTAGNVYIAGTGYGNLPGSPGGNSTDAFVGKLSAQGELQWLKRMSTTEEDAVNGLALDEATGALYVAGHTFGDLSGAQDNGPRVFVYRYDLDGNEQWLKQLQKGTYGATGFDLDPEGNPVLQGWLLGAFPGYNNPSAQDVFLMKLDPAGNQKWVKQFEAFGNDFSGPLAVDDAGNIYAATTPQYELPKVSKYNSDGMVQWTKHFDKGVSDLTLDPQQAVLVTQPANSGQQVTRVLSDATVSWNRTLTFPLGATLMSNLRAGQSGAFYATTIAYKALVKYTPDLTLPE